MFWFFGLKAFRSSPHTDAGVKGPRRHRVKQRGCEGIWPSRLLAVWVLHLETGLAPRAGFPK